MGEFEAARPDEDGPDGVVLPFPGRPGADWPPGPDDLVHTDTGADPSTERTGADPHDFTRLYVRHRPAMVSHARRFLRDPRDVDEVVQEAFLKLFLALPELSGELQCIAYCRRTISNLCIDRYRARTRAPQVVEIEDMDGLDSVEDGAYDDPVVLAEDAAIVRAALARLSPLHRDALVKREIEEKPLPVIAEELGIEAANVKHVLLRARRALRRLLVGTTADPSADPDLVNELKTAAARAGRGAGRVAMVLLPLVMAISAFGLFGGNGGRAPQASGPRDARPSLPASDPSAAAGAAQGEPAAGSGPSQPAQPDGFSKSAAESRAGARDGGGRDSGHSVGEPSGQAVDHPAPDHPSAGDEDTSPLPPVPSPDDSEPSVPLPPDADDGGADGGVVGPVAMPSAGAHPWSMAIDGQQVAATVRATEQQLTGAGVTTTSTLRAVGDAYRLGQQVVWSEDGTTQVALNLVAPLDAATAVGYTLSATADSWTQPDGTVAVVVEGTAESQLGTADRPVSVQLVFDADRTRVLAETVVVGS